MLPNLFSNVNHLYYCIGGHALFLYKQTPHFACDTQCVNYIVCVFNIYSYVKLMSMKYYAFWLIPLLQRVTCNPHPSSCITLLALTGWMSHNKQALQVHPCQFPPHNTKQTQQTTIPSTTSFPWVVLQPLGHHIYKAISSFILSTAEECVHWQRQ